MGRLRFQFFFRFGLWDGIYAICFRLTPSFPPFPPLPLPPPTPPPKNKTLTWRFFDTSVFSKFCLFHDPTSPTPWQKLSQHKPQPSRLHGIPEHWTSRLTWSKELVRWRNGLAWYPSRERVRLLSNVPSPSLGCELECPNVINSNQSHVSVAVVALKVSCEEVCFKDADADEEASSKGGGGEASIVGEKAASSMGEGEEGSSVREGFSVREAVSAGDEMATEVFVNVGFTSFGWSGSEISSTARVSPTVVVIGKSPPVQVPQPSSSWASLCNCRVLLLLHSSCW